MNSFRTQAEVRRATPAIEETKSSSSHVRGVLLRHLSLPVRFLGLFLLVIPVARGAGLIEDFSYSDGSLTAVSGGAWQRFDSVFALDATVSSGEVVVGIDSDVIRQFPAVLDAAGTMATYSFSINLGSGIYDNAGYVVSIQPASPPFGIGTINDASSFGVGFLGTAPFSQSSATADIYVIEGGQQLATPIGDLSTDAWHTFSIRLERASTAPNVSYSLWLDGSLLRTGTFQLSDSRAINSIEMKFATDGNPPASGYARIDDIQIIPISEPDAADDLISLGDEFDAAGTLSRWRRVFEAEGWGFDQLEQWDINTMRPGHMTMMPHTSSWYQEWRGVQAYKIVTGDFVVTTHVEARNRAGEGPPNAQFSLAGLMVRAPRPAVTNAASWSANGENYIFLSIGSADQAGTYQFEVKTTEDSVSDLEISPAEAGQARIQIARIGSYFICLRQFEGGPWTVHRRYERADMPATLNVGLTTYTDWVTCQDVGYQFHNTHLLTNGLPRPEGDVLMSANPDLVAAFDYLRLQRPAVPAPLAGREFTDPEQVTDADLLSFLGAQANRPGGSTTPSRFIEFGYDAEAGYTALVELVTNRHYRFQSGTNLSEWITHTDFVSTTNQMQLNDPLSAEDAWRLYRVVSP